MKVVAFAASNSSRSINKQLVLSAANALKTTVNPDADVELLDLNDYEMPLYSIDREENEGVPQAAHDFRTKIGQADALLVSYAEHNGNVTVAYKNIFDWMSRIDRDIFQGKPIVMLSTSPGGGGGANALKVATESAPHFGADVKATFTLPGFFDNFDSESGVVADEALRQSLMSALHTLKP